MNLRLSIILLPLIASLSVVSQGTIRNALQTPVLKEVFKNDFIVGTAIGYDEINGKYPGNMQLVKEQFNSVFFSGNGME